MVSEIKRAPLKKGLDPPLRYMYISVLHCVKLYLLVNQCVPSYSNYPLNHIIIAGSVPNLNYVQNRSTSYNHFDQPKSGSCEKKITIVTVLPK